MSKRQSSIAKALARVGTLQIRHLSRLRGIAPRFFRNRLDGIIDLRHSSVMRVTYV
jgi:hypothetical protein